MGGFEWPNEIFLAEWQFVRRLRASVQQYEPVRFVTPKERKMSRPDKPIKVVLTASICLVASSALQGTTATVQPDPQRQWKDVQQSIERDSDNVLSQGERGTLRFAGSPGPTPTGYPHPIVNDPPPRGKPTARKATPGK